MKKINKYLFGAFAALLTAGLFSCVETAPEYEPGTPDVAAMVFTFRRRKPVAITPLTPRSLVNLSSLLNVIV